jgi:hypothetical protein
MARCVSAVAIDAAALAVPRTGTGVAVLGTALAVRADSSRSGDSAAGGCDGRRRRSGADCRDVGAL